MGNTAEPMSTPITRYTCDTNVKMLATHGSDRHTEAATA